MIRLSLLPTKNYSQEMAALDSLQKSVEAEIKAKLCVLGHSCESADRVIEERKHLARYGVEGLIRGQ